MELTDISAVDIARQVKARELSAVDVVEAHLLRINKNTNLNAFLTVTSDEALARAKQIDARVAAGEPVGALAGAPMAVKDIIVTKGIRTTGGSRILEHYVPPYSATVVERIEAAGAIIVGKTNCDEFAMGGSGENSAYGPTKNPVDVTRVPGGSSSGSAAAVAAHLTPVALGTDTGGSIREPAAFCGVVGVKPSYGRVSRYGLMAMASSLDQAGPFARTVEDAALVLNVIAGHDGHDATCVKDSVPDYAAELSKGVAGMRFGIPREVFGEGLERGVEDALKSAAAALAKAGAKVTEISLPSLPYALAAYYIIVFSEISANLARYDGLRYGTPEAADSLSNLYRRTRGARLGAEVKRRIMLGTYTLSAGYYDAYYRKAQAARQSIKADFARAFKEVDAVLMPTAPTPAFPLGERVEDPLAMYLADIYTVPVNIAGLPGISVPWGMNGNLPLAVQIVGQRLGEGMILRAGAALEQASSLSI